jgi:hypothetical protein
VASVSGGARQHLGTTRRHAKQPALPGSMWARYLLARKVPLDPVGHHLSVGVAASIDTYHQRTAARRWAYSLARGRAPHCRVCYPRPHIRALAAVSMAKVAEQAFAVTRCNPRRKPTDHEQVTVERASPTQPLM